MPTRIADGYGYRYGIAAQTLAQRAVAFETQSAHRRRDASGRWVSSAWRAAGRFETPLPVPPLLAGATPGTTYLLRARTVDRVGNRGPWSAIARTDVPLDDRSPHIGWSRNAVRVTCPTDRVAGTRSCYGTGASGTGRAGTPATASLTTETRRFAVFATRCPRCGSLRVTVDGRHRATVSLRSASTRYRQLVYSSGLLGGATPTRHTLQLVASATGSRPLVQVDAIGLTR
jgi:hypothetical protein